MLIEEGLDSKTYHRVFRVTSHVEMQNIRINIEKQSQLKTI